MKEPSTQLDVDEGREARDRPPGSAYGVRLALRNVAYVSQHNATVERGHRDIKKACGLGKGVILRGHV